MPLHIQSRTAFGRGSKKLVSSWVPASGNWGSVPNSTFNISGIGWTPAPLAADSTAPYSDYTAVMAAYSGGVQTTRGIRINGVLNPGTFQLIWGGGHHDYSGNEWYAHGPYESDTPRWYRIKDPTIPAPLSVDRDASANPVSRHTYDHLVFLPETNEVLSVGVGGKFTSGTSGTAIDIFNVEALTYQNLGDMVGGGGVGTGISSDWNYGAAGYNPTTRKAWVSGKGNGASLQCFDVATRTMSSTTFNDPNVAFNSKGCVDPVRNLLIAMNASRQATRVDLTARDSSPTVLTVTGTAPLGTVTGQPGEMWELVWDTLNNRAVCWEHETGKIFFLTPNTTSPTTAWTWSSVTPGGTPPNNVHGSGIYGRVQFVELWGGGLIVYPNASNEAKFYRF